MSRDRPDRYIRARMDTAGNLDIQGVLLLSDLTEVPWTHGTQDHLRSLSTGNRRFELKLSMPFNDASSSLWWRPDEKV